MLSFHTHTLGRGNKFVINQWYMSNLLVILSMCDCIVIASNFSADIYWQGCVNKSLVQNNTIIVNFSKHCRNVRLPFAINKEIKYFRGH